MNALTPLPVRAYERATKPQVDIAHAAFQGPDWLEKRAIEDLSRVMTMALAIHDAADEFMAEIRNGDSKDALRDGERFLDDVHEQLDALIHELAQQRHIR